jgi:hypothetical protein
MIQKLLVGGVLGLLCAWSAAQMRDVPPGHWAYQSIEQLVQLGILEGYPDGTFRPNRTMTRAEFAQAIARAYRSIDERLRALERRIQTIDTPVPGQQPADPAQLRNQLNELRTQVQELQKLNEAVQTLQRLAQTFQEELRGLNVDVDALKRDMTALRARVDALEGKTERFKMSGDLTFGVYGTHSIDGQSAFTLNNSAIHPSGKLMESLSVTHELGLTFSGQINDQISGSATFVLGNYLPYVKNATKASFFLPTFAGVGRPAFTVGATDIVIWEAFVTAPIDLFGANVELTVGRFPISISPYTLRRGAPDAYLNFARYRDAKLRVDGGQLMFKTDTLRVQLWAAQSNWRSNEGIAMSLPITNHSSVLNAPNAALEQLAGARVEFDAVKTEGNRLTVGATYYAAGVGANRTFNHFGNPVATGIDRMDVFGADIKGQWRKLKLNAEYSQSDFLSGDTRVIRRDNWVVDANLAYEFSNRLNAVAGYREIRPYFAAAGAWGRVGYLYRPSDLRGFYANLNYTVSDDLKFNLSGELLEGTGRATYRTDDEATRLVAGVDYRLTDKWSLAFNYEGVFWKVSAATSGTPNGVKPVWNYYTLNVAYNLGQNAALNLLYQIIDTDGKGFTLLSGGPSANKNSAAAAATTLSVRF